jgi:large subunit ribosomal protein L25
MEQILIRADKRNVKGKGIARKLRNDGKIPAVLYGRDLKPVSITVLSKDWEKLGGRTRRNVIFNMELHGDSDVENRPVMVKEIQRECLGEKILHIDFLQVSMERTIEVEIPIHLKGKAKGEVEGGIVEMHLRSMKVECLPTEIPEEIAIDISELEIGDSLHVHQISIPGVKLLEGADVAIITIIPPAVEEKPVVEEVLEPEEGKEKEEKKEEDKDKDKKEDKNKDKKEDKKG